MPAAPRKRHRSPTPAEQAFARRMASRVSPDKLDLRDRMYQPPVGLPPRPECFPMHALAIKMQGDTSACTGFALSTVVEYLLAGAKREPTVALSGFMLYSMARRYDEFPGSPKADTGSSLRGALKGWYHHGVCRSALWSRERMPDATNDPATDWWLDAAKRPLGAYYRIDTRAITDMHVAINDAGVVYASVVCHAGWDAGYTRRPAPKKVADIWEIPRRKVAAVDGGHAFAIVGYGPSGFVVQNSWGRGWGSQGYAILPYDDWLDNAMDCWVAQLGVETEEHKAVAEASTLRTDSHGKTKLASAETLQQRELSPFIIDMENNGALSSAGRFRTTPGDVTALVTYHLAEARRKWGLKPTEPVDVAIYAHGGLNGEDAAAQAAAAWIPMLYDQRIFPIFFMWETDLLTTAVNLLDDAVKGVPRAAGGFLGDAARAFHKWLNARIERTLAEPGTALWGEMKQNADAISGARSSGGRLLYEAFRTARALKGVRLHLIGHSAGAIVHSFLIDRLAQENMTFESVHFMAPAVRLDTFERLVVPHIRSGRVRRYQQFHLTEVAEEADPTCSPYGRSLLYLVSESFEGGKTTPLLGMQKYFDPWLARTKLKHVEAIAAPGRLSQATSHGGFDDDAATQRRILAACRA